MSELVKVDNSLAARLDDADMIRTLKETVCKGATDAQFRMFTEICRSTGLNPFLKEIWFVPGVGVMAGRDGYLRVANEHPMFDGMETLVDRDNTGKPIKATCKVWRKDRNHPITCEAYYNEYKKGGNVWSTYPSAMIQKVAEVMALKRSFSINGVVTEEEIGTEAERGSHEAQQEVAQKKLAKMKGEAPAEDVIDVAPEQQESVVQMAPDKFKALAAFAELKQEIVAATGSDGLYYQALGSQGYEKSNEIKAADMRKVFKAVATAFTDWKAVQPMDETPQ